MIQGELFAPAEAANPDACHYCGAKAIAWCDWIDREQMRTARDSTPVKTCDRPLCTQHVRKVGHICVRGRRGHHAGCDTIDHCREHPP